MIFSYSISSEISFLARTTEAKVVGKNHKRPAYFLLLYLLYFFFFTLQMLLYSYALFEEDRQRRKLVLREAPVDFKHSHLQYLCFVFWYSTYASENASVNSFFSKQQQPQSPLSKWPLPLLQPLAVVCHCRPLPDLLRARRRRRLSLDSPGRPGQHQPRPAGADGCPMGQ